METPGGVEAYLAALPEEQRATLEKVRATVRAAAPGATEAISYGMPAFKDRGRSLVAYAAFKHHCSFFPMSGGVMKAFEDELRAYDTSKGTIRFTVDRPLPATLVKKLVKAKIAENEARRRR